MAASNEWIDVIRKAQKSCLIQDGKKKIHYTFTDGKQMVEEFDIETNNLLVRKHSSKTTLGDVGRWEYEVGQDTRPSNPDALGISESSSNPICVRKDSRRVFEWRIRNLPYTLDTYNVSVDPDHRHIVIRTSNKKYYRKFSIEDMERLKLSLDETSLSYAHANNTLIVTYAKPAAILDLEQKIRAELATVQNTKDGDINMCAPS